MSYRPLPSSICIKQSAIDGMGLFATTTIEAGTNLGVTHFKTPVKGLFLQDYCRTPLGGFYNHSDTPNCQLIKRVLGSHININSDKTMFVPNYSYDVLELWTMEKIEQGQEITCSYTLYQIKSLQREANSPLTGSKEYPN